MCFVCGQSEAIHELYESILKNLDYIEKWNKDVRKFMVQERKPSTLVVTF